MPRSLEAIYRDIAQQHRTIAGNLRDAAVLPETREGDRADYLHSAREYDRWAENNDALADAAARSKPLKAEEAKA